MKLHPRHPNVAKRTAVLSLLVLIALPVHAEVSIRSKDTRDSRIRMTNNSSYVLQRPSSQMPAGTVGNPNAPEKIKTLGNEKPGQTSQTNQKSLKSNQATGLRNDSDQSVVRSELRTSSKKGSTWDDDRNFNQVSVNAFPLLGKGVGLNYDRAVLDRLTVGPFFETLAGTTDTSAANDIVKFDLEYRMYQAGLRSRFFVMGNADESGLYILGAASYTMVEVKSSYSGGDQSLERASAFGGAGGLGYQIAARYLGGKTRMLFNLGAGYGTGYKIKTTVLPTLTSSNGLGSETTSNIDAGLMIDTSIGLMF